MCQKWILWAYFLAICLKLAFSRGQRDPVPLYLQRDPQDPSGCAGYSAADFPQSELYPHPEPGGAGAIPTQLVSEMLALNIPSMALLMLPISLFIAILFAHGRLYAESEMTVMKAIGIGPASIMRSTQWLAAITMVIAIVNSMCDCPLGRGATVPAAGQGEGRSRFLCSG